MNLKKQLLTNNNCYRAGEKLVVRGVMWHSTGAANTNLKRYVQPNDGVLGHNKYGNHWNTSTPGGRQVCVHAFIGLTDNGDVATYQTLPWDMRGWHAGGSANDSYIGFEICEDDLNSREYFDKVYKEACELTAYLCSMYKLDPLKDGIVICHSEGYSRGIASNHSDVMHWFKRFGKTMNDVRNDVNKIMKKNSAAAQTKSLYRVQSGVFNSIDKASKRVEVLKKKGFDAYIVKVDGKLKVQCGAYANKRNAEALAFKLKELGYTAYVTTKPGNTVKVPAQTAAIKVGDKVKVKSGAKSYEGKSVSSFVYTKTYTVDQLKGSRAVLDLKGICTAFNVKDLTKA